MSLQERRSGAVFPPEGERLTLFASLGIDRQILDAVETIWGRYRNSLQKREPASVPAPASERRFKAPKGSRVGPTSFALLPVFDGSDLVALLYVDSTDPRFCNASDLERLQKLSRIVARAVGAGTSAGAGAASEWQAYLERTPVEDIEREKLLLLLNRNEWNIARVARLIGVTRRTIYLRLRRYKIPRERLRKSRVGSGNA